MKSVFRFGGGTAEGDATQKELLGGKGANLAEMAGIGLAVPPGLTIATGLSGHGFGIGPAFGRILADLMTGKPPGHDLHPFRLSRFSDGSVIAPTGAL